MLIRISSIDVTGHAVMNNLSVPEVPFTRVKRSDHVDPDYNETILCRLKMSRLAKTSQITKPANQA